MINTLDPIIMQKDIQKNILEIKLFKNDNIHSTLRVVFANQWYGPRQDHRFFNASINKLGI